MPFSNTWDATFESQPADSENINLGANRIRALKVAIRERMQIDHVWEDGDEDGKHNVITLTPNVTPATASPDAFLWGMDISSNTELIFKDSTGNIVQLTAAGAPYPVAPGDFSVTQDLAVGQAAVIGGATSFASATVADMTAFATSPQSQRVFQFATNTYFMYDPSLLKVLLVVNGVTEQQWPP